MSGKVLAASPDVKPSYSPGIVHVYKGRNNLQLCSGVALNSSSSSRISHRRALRRNRVTLPRLGRCHCRAAADTDQGAVKLLRPCNCYCKRNHEQLLNAAPSRRRGRRYRDGLLDNLEVADRQGNPRADPRRQANKKVPDTSSIPDSNTTGDKAEEGIGWGEGGVPDDWGWGLDNPTLAAATGSYESELQARQGAYAKQSRSGLMGGSDHEDNWDVPETQVEADWDEETEEEAADDGLVDSRADVTLLDSREVDQLLKIAPRQQQVQYFSGTPVDLGVRVGTGLLLTLGASKLPLLAAGTLCFPLWWPICKAWWQNQKLRSQYRYVGLWQTSVLELNLAGPPRLRQEPTKPTINFLFGDDSSARTQVDVPYNQRYEEVHVGEPAELLLLSNTPDFSSFKALKEVYLPESGVWIAKYPFVDRDVFLDISLDIERERKTQQAAEWPT